MAAREQWEQCLAQLRASTRPDAAAIEEIVRALLGLPYPLEFCREADEVGNLLCDLCRLARLDVRVSLTAVSELAATLTTKHSAFISEGNMQTIVTFFCSAIESPEADTRQRNALLRALSAILYGNGQRCANLVDGLLKILLPSVTNPATTPSASRGGAAAWLEEIELQRLTLDCLGSLFAQTTKTAADARGVGAAGMRGGGGFSSQCRNVPSPGYSRGRGRAARGGYGRGRGVRDYDPPIRRAEGRITEARGRVFMVVNRTLQAYALGYGDDAGLSKLLCSALRCVYLCIGGDEALLQPHDLRQVTGLAHSLLGDPTDASSARRRAQTQSGSGRPILQLSSKRGGSGGAGSRDWSRARGGAGEKASGGSSGRDWSAARQERRPSHKSRQHDGQGREEEDGSESDSGYSSGGGSQSRPRTVETLSRVRFHALLLLQAVARCTELRNEMYEQWKSLLPSTVAEAVAESPYTTTVATVLLHDPDPRTRRTASSTLHAMLDGSKRYLASAELDRDRSNNSRSGVRGGAGSSASRTGMRRFASLSQTLAVWVCAFHEVLLESLKKETDSVCVVSLLKTLAVLLVSSPYDRLKSTGVDLLCKVAVAIENTALAAAVNLRTPPPHSKRAEAEPVIAACCACLRNGLNGAYASQVAQASANAAAAAVAAGPRFLTSLKNQKVSSADDDETKQTQKQAGSNNPTTSVVLDEMMAACGEPDRPTFVVAEALQALVAFGRHCRGDFFARWAHISSALRRCLSHADENVRLYAARCIEEHTRPLIVEGEGDVDSAANQQRILDEESRSGKGPEMAFWSELLASHIKLAIKDSSCVVHVAGIACLANIPAHIYSGLGVEVREWVCGNMRRATADSQHTVREEGWRALGWICRHPAARADAAFVDQLGKLLVTAMQTEATSRVRIRCVWCVANLCAALAEEGQSTRESPEELVAAASAAAAAASAMAKPETQSDSAIQEVADAYGKEQRLSSRITVSFADDGKLGIVFEKDVTPLVIKRITPNTLAAEKPELQPGLVLQDVGYPAPWAGAPINKASYKEAIRRLKEATRPITFVFTEKGSSSAGGVGDGKKDRGIAVSGGYGKFANAQLEAGRRPWLVSLAECSMQSMDEPDKIQANGARALGSLAALLLQPRIVRENKQAAELQPRVVDSLLRGASARAPKVAWNACYALSNLLRVAGKGNSISGGHGDLPTLMIGRILDTLLQALLFSPNFKVRLSAAVGLTTPKTASEYCGRLGEALATVCEAASQFETNSFGSRRPLVEPGLNFGQKHTRGGRLDGFGRGSGPPTANAVSVADPTSPLGRFSRPGARVGMVSLSAEEDRANLKHKAALRTQLEATVLHLLRVAVAHPEADPAPAPAPAPGPEPEPEPEPEATIDCPKGEIDTESPSARAGAEREARLARIASDSASGGNQETTSVSGSGNESSLVVETASAGSGEGAGAVSKGGMSAEVVTMLLPHVPLVSRLLGQQMPPAMDVAAALCAGFHAAAAQEHDTAGATELWAAAAELEAAVSAVADATSVVEGILG